MLNTFLKINEEYKKSKKDLFSIVKKYIFEYEDEVHEITWKDLSQEEAYKYRLWYECSTYRDFKGYVTTAGALKLFNDGVEYGKYQALKNKE